MARGLGVCGLHTGVTHDGTDPVLQPRGGRVAPCPSGQPSPGPSPRARQGLHRGAGLTQGRGGHWAAGGPRALIPSSCRFPQIDSLLTFFSAAGSAAQIDGAASPAPLSFLSLLLISAPINQPPPPLGDKCFLSHEGLCSHGAPQSTCYSL